MKKALLVQLHARPGKEKDVEAFLAGALPLVAAEPATVTWYALSLGDGAYGIFDTFDDDAGRAAHLNGKVAEALMAQADELFDEPPQIGQVDVLADKH